MRPISPISIHSAKVRSGRLRFQGEAEGSVTVEDGLASLKQRIPVLTGQNTRLAFNHPERQIFDIHGTDGEPIRFMRRAKPNGEWDKSLIFADGVTIAMYTPFQSGEYWTSRHSVYSNSGSTGLPSGLSAKATVEFLQGLESDILKLNLA